MAKSVKPKTSLQKGKQIENASTALVEKSSLPENEELELSLDSDFDPDAEAEAQASAEPTHQDSFPVVYDPYDQSALESAEKQIEKRVSATDPLKRYLQEIKYTVPLSSEQEQHLAKRMHEAGDVNAAKMLVTANLKLVVRIAYEYRSFYHNLLDLIQEGNVGLMKAVSKFDPTKGARLGYYASWWIRSYILKYLLDNFRLVRVGTSQAQKKLFYHLMREKQRLEAQGVYPAAALIAHNLEVKEKDVIEMQQRLLSPGAEMSIDAPSPSNPDEPNTSLLNTLFDHRELADVSLERDEWLQILKKELPLFAKELNEKEKMILAARILAEEPKTLQEVADEFGLTRERVRQIESRLIDKLKVRLTPYFS